MRYDGPYSMNLRDPARFARTLLVNALVWEVPRVLVGFAYRRRYRATCGKGGKHAEFAALAPSHVMSFVHAVVISVLGLFIMRETWNYPIYDKFYVNDRWADPSRFTLNVIELTNWLFFGYMTDDLAHVLVKYPKLGKADMVAHHLVFIACAILAGGTQSFLFPFSWLLAGELSTPLLALRWFIRTLAGLDSPTLAAVATRMNLLQSRRDADADADADAEAKTATAKEAAGALEAAVTKTFVFVFFVVRVCVFGAGLAHTLRFHAAHAAVPAGARAAIMSILLAGAGLNAFWFRLMIVKVLGFGGKREKRE